MSPSVEYPLAITDMEAVCQAKHGGISACCLPRALATEHPTLPLTWSIRVAMVNGLRGRCLARLMAAFPRCQAQRERGGDCNAERNCPSRHGRAELGDADRGSVCSEDRCLDAPERSYRSSHHAEQHELKEQSPATNVRIVPTTLSGCRQAHDAGHGNAQH
jgi:hypothetical protein